MFFAEQHKFVLCEIRGVAQPGSALAWGARGREFESRRPDQYFKGLQQKRCKPLFICSLGRTSALVVFLRSVIRYGELGIITNCFFS